MSLKDKTKKILEDELLNFHESLSSSIEKEILNNFDNERDVNGKPFHPLTGTTKEIRRSRGTWPGKILNETGALRNSIKVNAFKRSVLISSSVGYAQELNDGRDNMKKREILEIPDNHATDGKKYNLIWGRSQRKILKKYEKLLLQEIEGKNK